MKSSGAEKPLLGLLGLALLLWLFSQALERRLDGAELARLYQGGFARSSVKLIAAADAAPFEIELLKRRLERADAICRFDPERLRATPPFLLADDGRFWPAVSDVHPPAAMDLSWDDGESGRLDVRPERAPAWHAALRSKELVQPDWSPYSGLVAYYDLGRVWIADVGGRRFQSLVQEPLLDEGGVLKFSADGTALAFYFYADRTWKAQDLYVLVEQP